MNSASDANLTQQAEQLKKFAARGRFKRAIHTVRNPNLETLCSYGMDSRSRSWLGGGGGVQARDLHSQLPFLLLFLLRFFVMFLLLVLVLLLLLYYSPKPQVDVEPSIGLRGLIAQAVSLNLQPVYP